MSMFTDGVENILEDPVGDLRDDAPATPSEDTVTETEAPAEPEADTANQQERDEQGRFVTSDEQAQKFLDKYDGDLEKALKAASESQSLIGRMGQELGELRSVLDELPNRMQPAKQTALPPNFDELLSDNPQQVAMWALQQGDQGPVYDAAMREWYDQSPMEAARFEQELRMEMLRSEIQAAQQPIQQTLREQQQQAAVQDFARQNPDVFQHAEKMGELGRANPALTRLLESDDPAERVGALAVLYQLAKGSQPAPLGDTPAPTPDTDAARAQAVAAAEQAKQAAAVITGGNSNTGDAPAPNIADQIWDAWGQHDIGRLRNS